VQPVLHPAVRHTERSAGSYVGNEEIPGSNFNRVTVALTDTSWLFSVSMDKCCSSKPTLKQTVAFAVQVFVFFAHLTDFASHFKLSN
jgi:hypothetical protein